MSEVNDPFDFGGLDDLVSDDNKPESNWFKFKKVGDEVRGVFLDSQEVGGTGGMPDQVVYEILTKEKDEVKVGIAKSKKYVIDAMKKVRKGDLVCFKFEKTIPAKQKGYNDSKVIQPYIKFTEAGDKIRAEEAKL